jgi:hypothetical protein
VSPAVTVTSADAVPSPDTFRVPLDGLTVTPEGAEAVHCTGWEPEVSDFTVKVVFDDSPGGRISDDGFSEPVAANVGPYDGGAFEAPVPHEVSAVLIVQSRDAPLASVEYGTYSLLLAFPFSFMDLT